MYAAVQSAALLGSLGTPVIVEAHVGNGIPGFTIVGLPDEGCRESRDRVRAALLSSGLNWPNRRVTINLAGSGERRGGAALDLAIAMGLLVAQGDVPAEAVRSLAFVAELGLDGSLRRMNGVAPLVAAVCGHEVVVAPEAVGEARLARAPMLRAVGTLRELVDILVEGHPWPTLDHETAAKVVETAPDMADVRGQYEGRQALEIAAAGFHHLLMVGPPGAGKSMLASRLPSLLPRLTDEEAFACAMARSAAGLSASPQVSTIAPFRAPHHSISLAGMVGGGSATVSPGEITLAANGVLFLDEMGEFAPSVLDALRQPLEEGVVHVARAGVSMTMAANCLLVAATNPCPCGLDGFGGCRCGPSLKERYMRRFSAPMLDRFDLRIRLPRPSTAELTSTNPGETSAVVARRVALARARALDRQGCLNGHIRPEMLDAVAPLSSGAMNWLRTKLDEGELSARGYHRIRRVARTMADLAGDEGPIEQRLVESAFHWRTDVLPVRISH